MKLALISLFIIGFLGISLFGFTAMNGDTNHNRCLAVIASGGIACLDMNGLMGMVSVHFGAFHKFSNAVFGENFLTPLLIFIGVLSAIIFQIKKNHSFAFQNSIQVFYKKRNNFQSLPLKLELNHWLALREKSPAVF